MSDIELLEMLRRNLRTEISTQIYLLRFRPISELREVCRRCGIVTERMSYWGSGRTRQSEDEWHRSFRRGLENDLLKLHASRSWVLWLFGKTFSILLQLWYTWSISIDVQKVQSGGKLQEEPLSSVLSSFYAEINVGPLVGEPPISSNLLGIVSSSLTDPKNPDFQPSSKKDLLDLPNLFFITKSKFHLNIFSESPYLTSDLGFL